MNLSAVIYTELTRLASLSPDEDRRLDLDVEGGRVEIRCAAVDQLACSFEQFVLHIEPRRELTIEQLIGTAEKLRDRLTYLLESVTPLETDRQAGVVQMRSAPPTKDDQATRYYELVVRNEDIDLRRYEKTPDKSRHAVPAAVTREVLCRLSEDVVASIADE
jgi:hypothetical protein